MQQKVRPTYADAVKVIEAAPWAERPKLIKLVSGQLGRGVACGCCDSDVGAADLAKQIVDWLSE